MQCDVCKQKKATVFLTQIVKGEMQKVNLCEGCSKENGITDPMGFSLAEKLMGMGYAHGEKIETQPQERTCPACGMPQTTFRKTGRLGCAKCYQTFSEGLDNLLKAMHKDIRHKGKVPVGCTRAEPEPPIVEVPAAPPPPVPPQASLPPPPPAKKTAPVKSLESRLTEMRAAMDSAIAQENFEDAARLRDEIKRLQETV